MSTTNMMPNILKETASGISQIRLSDALLDKREVYLTTDVNTESATLLMQQLSYLDRTEPGSPIRLYINSPGGSVNDGLAVYDLMQILESPITTICTGRAASMGAILFLGAQERLMLPHSEIMIHDASFGGADFSGLKPDEIQTRTDSLVKTCKILRQIVADRTGQSLKSVTAKMKADSYFSAQEALDYHLATGMLRSISG